MSRCNGIGGLELADDPILYKQVRKIFSNRLSGIMGRNGNLAFNFEADDSQLNCQCVLIYLLEKSCPQGIVHLEGARNDLLGNLMTW
ncbi:MAG: hypothetical protein A2140_05880 [Candidatus Muproteobacteria bacterium RBG_16_62_13]|uniref:Uncharacterized protein n=1 Tax=Candidatus Muproteobacteria bacterium RBG_16_62_13 TaxID=1817756 RepID=A0A1F6T0E8_9PROT|nr:MAG: hypothetical protein A2140_05880 [Candidatus Muproteobacteria bacterium RBG_16_62_13]